MVVGFDGGDAAVSVSVLTEEAAGAFVCIEKLCGCMFSCMMICQLTMHAWCGCLL